MPPHRAVAKSCHPCTHAINPAHTLMILNRPLTLGRTCTCSHLPTWWSVYGRAPRSGATDSTTPACGQLGDGSASTATGRDRNRLECRAAATAAAAGLMPLSWLPTSGAAGAAVVLSAWPCRAASCCLDRPATALQGRNDKRGMSVLTTSPPAAYSVSLL